MNLRKFISGVSALAIAASAFAGMAVTASAADTVVSSISNATVGDENCNSGWWNYFSDTITMSDGDVLTYEFKNKTKGVENYQNWTAYATNDVDRQGEGYEEYAGLRADIWDYVNSRNGLSWNDAYESIDWTAFKSDMDGASVTVTYTYANSVLTINAKAVTSNSSKTYEETETISGITGTIRTFLVVNDSYIYELNSSKTTAASHQYTFSESFNSTDISVTGATGVTGGAVNTNATINGTGFNTTMPIYSSYRSTGAYIGVSDGVFSVKTGNTSDGNGGNSQSIYAELGMPAALTGVNTVDVSFDWYNGEFKNASNDTYIILQDSAGNEVLKVKYDYANGKMIVNSQEITAASSTYAKTLFHVTATLNFSTHQVTSFSMTATGKNELTATSAIDFSSAAASNVSKVRLGINRGQSGNTKQNVHTYFDNFSVTGYAKSYLVSFDVTDGTNTITDATVTLEGVAANNDSVNAIYNSATGKYEAYVPVGRTPSYTVTATGCEPVDGTLALTAIDMDIPVTCQIPAGYVTGSFASAGTITGTSIAEAGGVDISINSTNTDYEVATIQDMNAKGKVIAMTVSHTSGTGTVIVYLSSNRSSSYITIHLNEDKINSMKGDSSNNAYLDAAYDKELVFEPNQSGRSALPVYIDGNQKTRGTSTLLNSYGYTVSGIGIKSDSAETPLVATITDFRVVDETKLTYGDGNGTKVYAADTAASTPITLATPVDSKYTGWMIDGTYYAAGASYTAAESVTATPAFEKQADQGFKFESTLNAVKDLKVYVTKTENAVTKTSDGISISELCATQFEGEGNLFFAVILENIPEAWSDISVKVAE